MNRITIVAIAAALTMAANTGWTEPLEIGSTAPHPEGTTQDGTPFSFAEAYTNPWVLVFFYPKADTRGCTLQACSLRDAYEQLTELGVAVIGVSLDSVEDQAAFASKHELPFTLIADPAGNVVEAFGVPTTSRGTMRFASRQAFLVKGETIVWRDLSASTADQARDVLAVITSYGSQG